MEVKSYFSPKELSFDETPKGDMGKLDHFMSKIETTVANITRLESKIGASPERSVEVPPNDSFELKPEVPRNFISLSDSLEPLEHPNLPPPLNLFLPLA